MTYIQKDLGYHRASTNAVFRVQMEDLSLWDVPVQAIADSRDAFYAEDKEDTVQGIRDGGLAAAEINDWAGNEMNWSDVQAFATQVPSIQEKRVDWQEGWVNGEKKIVGEI